MKKKRYLPGDIEASVRWALRERVERAEPSPAVWEGIRRRIVAERKAQGRTWLCGWLRVRPVVQAVAAGVVIVGLGLTAGLSSLTAREDPGVVAGERPGPGQWQASELYQSDNLNSRLERLARGQVTPAERGLRHRFIE